MNLYLTISFFLVLGLDVWIILSSIRGASRKKYFAVIPFAVVLAALYCFLPEAGVPTGLLMAVLVLYPIGYLHRRILSDRPKHSQVSVKVLGRSVLVALYSLVLLSVLAFGYSGFRSGSLYMYVASYSIALLFAALLAFRSLKGGIYGSAANNFTATRLEEKVLCTYTQDYMNTVCSSRNNDAIFSRVELYFKSEEMPFVKSDLLLVDVAKSVMTNKVYLSRAIHSKTGLNFCKYVNKYRVEYAKELYMKNPTLHVNELATMSGFATMTTFCNAFRDVEGMSPGDWTRYYIQNIKNKNQQ